MVKVLLVTDNIIDTLRDVYFVMTKIGNGLNFHPSQGILLRTLSNAIIRVAPGTQFEDENGNNVVGHVRAMLKFMDRNRDVGTSPGEFITEGYGQNLQAFSVFNVVFRDSGFRDVYPAELTPITVEIVNLRIEELTLWQLNDNGRWEQFSQDDGYQIGNAQIVGYLHAKHMGQWIALGQIDDQGLCYVKLRLFEDLTFTSEVRDKQADLYSPDIAMKIVNASHPRSSKALLLRPLEGTRSPGQDCHAVRCTDAKSVSGGISVLVTETRGNMISMPVPAIPIALDHQNLPTNLRTKLTALGYEVDWRKSRASLRFEASSYGPFYADKEACKLSTISENSLWFARRTPSFSENAFGDKVCFAKIRFYLNGYGHYNYDSLIGTSVWETNPSKFATSVTHGTSVACLRYRCSENDDPTKVYLKVEFNELEHGITCNEQQMSFTPSIGVANTGGYFVGSDESEVRDRCLEDKNYDPYVHTVECDVEQ